MENTRINDEYEELQKKVNDDSRPRKRYLESDEGSNVVGWIGAVTEVIHRYGIKKVLQAMLLIVTLISFLMFVNAMDNQNIIENFIENSYEKHTNGFDIRTEVNPKVNNEIIKLLYECGADRVSVVEMHNGKENPTSLPFKYCEMTYEQTRKGVAYVSDDYLSLNMSKYTFFSHIYEKKMFLSTIDELYGIDRKLALRMDGNKVKYFALILLNTNVDIGFLIVSFENMPTISREELTSKLITSSHKISNFLDYVKQCEIKKIENKKW